MLLQKKTNICQIGRDFLVSTLSVYLHILGRAACNQLQQVPPCLSTFLHFLLNLQWFLQLQLTPWRTEILNDLAVGSPKEFRVQFFGNAITETSCILRRYQCLTEWTTGRIKSQMSKHDPAVTCAVKEMKLVQFNAVILPRCCHAGNDCSPVILFIKLTRH